MSIRDATPVVALEISALGDRTHSGIPNVAKALAREVLGDTRVEAKFFMSRTEVPRPLVERFLEFESGDMLWWILERIAACPSFSPSLERPHIAIYASKKCYTRLFPTEVLIVHDLTPVVTPQFHNRDNIEDWHHHHALLGMLSSDLLVAVSDSTQADLRTYFPQVAHIPCLVAKIAPHVRGGAIQKLDRKPVDYVLVLGTLEPRKNIRVILQCLADHPQLLDDVSFLFVGRKGWGDSEIALATDLGLGQQILEGKILFTDFLSDNARDLLLSCARLVVYPSRYEGFGLPIAEALALGTPVLTSYSSSIPEVGGESAHYCDIDSPADFYQSLSSLLRSGASFADKQARMTWASQFSWRATYEKIREAALALALRRKV